MCARVAPSKRAARSRGKRLYIATATYRNRMRTISRERQGAALREDGVELDPEITHTNVANVVENMDRQYANDDYEQDESYGHISNVGNPLFHVNRMVEDRDMSSLTGEDEESDEDESYFLDFRNTDESALENMLEKLKVEDTNRVKNESRKACLKTMPDPHDQEILHQARELMRNCLIVSKEATFFQYHGSAISRQIYRLNIDNQYVAKLSDLCLKAIGNEDRPNFPYKLNHFLSYCNSTGGLSTVQLKRKWDRLVSAISSGYPSVRRTNNPLHVSTGETPIQFSSFLNHSSCNSLNDEMLHLMISMIIEQRPRKSDFNVINLSRRVVREITSRVASDLFPDVPRFGRTTRFEDLNQVDLIDLRDRLGEETEETHPMVSFINCLEEEVSLEYLRNVGSRASTSSGPMCIVPLVYSLDGDGGRLYEVKFFVFLHKELSYISIFRPTMVTGRDDGLPFSSVDDLLCIGVLLGKALFGLEQPIAVSDQLRQKCMTRAPVSSLYSLPPASHKPYQYDPSIYESNIDLSGSACLFYMLDKFHIVPYGPDSLVHFGDDPELLTLFFRMLIFQQIMRTATTMISSISYR